MADFNNTPRTDLKEAVTHETVSGSKIAVMDDLGIAPTYRTCQILFFNRGGTARHVAHDLGFSQNQITEIATPTAAIAAISLGHIDLIVLTSAAGSSEAVHLCRMLRRAQVKRVVPIFVVFETEDLESEVRAIEAGADEVIVPPFRTKAVQARIDASLRQSAMIDALDDSEMVLFSLAQSVEERDPALGQHCERLALMAEGMGTYLGLPEADVLALYRGGYLHDIGKVAIPDQVLFKEGPLSSGEWRLMRSHPEKGVRICHALRSLSPVLPIILHHHEKWDGSGYPYGLKKDEIPLLARILQLADVYDALTTHRAYKAALSPEQAVQVILGETEKGWRDPELVARLIPVLPTFSELPGHSLHALGASLDSLRGGRAFGRSSEAIGCLRSALQSSCV